MSLLLGLLGAVAELAGGIACALLVAILFWRGFRRFGRQQWGPAAGCATVSLLLALSPVSLGHFSTILILFSAVFALGAFTIAPRSDPQSRRQQPPRFSGHHHIFR